jgi:hypothetical protein
VKYELGLHIPEDGIPHSHRRENIKPYTCTLGQLCPIVQKTLEGLRVLQNVTVLMHILKL